MGLCCLKIVVSIGQVLIMELEGALLLVRINFCKFFDPISFVYLCMKEKTLKKVTTIQGVNPSIHDVEKWSNIL